MLNPLLELLNWSSYQTFQKITTLLVGKDTAHQTIHKNIFSINNSYPGTVMVAQLHP